MAMNIMPYLSNESLIYKLDPRVKIAMLVAMVIIPMLFVDLLIEFLLVIIIFTLALMSGIKINVIWKFLKPITPLFLFLIIFDTFFESWGTTVFFQFGVIKLYLEGALFGLTMVFRMLTMVLATIIVIVTTDPASFIIAIRSLGVPHKLAFMLSTSLRFVPTLMGKALQIQDAQKSRGLKSGDEVKSIFKKVSTMIPILIPLFVTSLELAQKLSLAMDARGFGASKTVTYSRDLNINKVDLVFLVIIISLTIVFVVLRIKGIGMTMLGTLGMFSK
ncbi:MAG TPA: energy-coupling factor transporter transmembrane component T [Brevefilum sp.]|nr:energy-coupling factor transporter transmembrane component T [Brevefilum sp.]HOR18813.1 energy-coupling factor transporter transmembrane component T [Brevefilum sp.]HPL68713.1 energy-coupling factor transporter transmembrane component T [Brevefilum sp.]